MGVHEENRPALPIKATPYRHQMEAYRFACGLFGLLPGGADEAFCPVALDGAADLFGCGDSHAAGFGAIAAGIGNEHGGDQGLAFAVQPEEIPILVKGEGVFQPDCLLFFR